MPNLSLRFFLFALSAKRVLFGVSVSVEKRPEIPPKAPTLSALISYTLKVKVQTFCMLKRTETNNGSLKGWALLGQIFFENLNIAAFSKILIGWVNFSETPCEKTFGVPT